MAKAEDPKAAARAIGQAGAAAAGAIAKSAGSAATVPGYAGTGVPERKPDGIGHGGCRPDPVGRSRRSGRGGRAHGDRGHGEPPRRGSAGGRSGGDALGTHRGVAAILRPRRRRACVRQRLGLRGRAGRRASRRVLRERALVRRVGVRERLGAGQHRVRACHDPAEHGHGARRRGVRPRRHALLHRQAARLPHQVVRPRQLLQEQRRAGRACRLQCRGTGAGEGTQRRQHPLSRQVLLEAHLLRGVHPPVSGVVRVRLQARAHPAGTGAQPARGRLGRLPGAVGGRDRGHRLRAARPLRVHRQFDGRRDGARDRPARGGRYAVGHADRIRDFYSRGN